jgi:predicted NBD/HSP70 family sugar kinase
VKEKIFDFHDREASQICGKAVSSIMNVFNPDIVFFGGKFMRQLKDLFLEPIRNEASKSMNGDYSLGEKRGLFISREPSW